MKRKESALEAQVFAAWEDLAFRDGGFDRPPPEIETDLQNTRERMPEWAAIADLAHDGLEWKVRSEYASMVSTSIWYSAMAIGEYRLAEEVIERCLEHPGSFDRHDSATLPIRLRTTRFVRDRSPASAKSLRDHIACGIYPPSAIAREIIHCLSCWIEPLWYDGRGLVSPVSDEAKSLALELAIAVRAGKRHQAKSEAIQTWEDFGNYLAQSM